MKKAIVRFLKDESGQTSTEYILLLVVAALFVFKFKNIAVVKLEEIINKIFSKTSTIVDEL